MSIGIYSIFGIASSSMFASQTGLQVASHNIANVDTPYYSKQSMITQTNTPSMNFGLVMGQGVNVSSIKATEDRFLNHQINLNSFVLGRLETQSRGSDMLQEIFNETGGTGLSSTLDQFFSSLQDLASNPEGQAERTGVLGAAENVATDFQRIASRLQDLQETMDLEIRGGISQVNSLAEQIADLNVEIANLENAGQNAADLRASRNAALNELASYVDFHSYENESGQVTVYLSAGLPLVTNDIHSSLEAVNDATNNNYAQIHFVDPNGNHTDVSESIEGGSLRGALDVRDVQTQDVLDQIDELAYELVSQFNSLHSAGYGLNGSTGNNFFEDLGASSEGAASSIAIDASILADVNNIAAAQIDQVGDNRNALALADLQENMTMNGGTWTFNDFYSAVVGDVAMDAQQDQISYDHQEAVTMQIVNYRESIAGVSLEEEMANMMKFQSSYEASAKLFNVANEMLDTLLSLK